MRAALLLLAACGPMESPLSVVDDFEAPLAYGVALVAFRSQVEFGAVRIEPMDSEIRVD